VTSEGSGEQVQPSQASAWNIANALTVLRIALVPVFGWFLLHEGDPSMNYRLIAAGVFVVATATDRIDGDIARARGIVTDFGKVSDPIADKALMGMAFVGLSIIGSLPWWVTAVVLVREIGITALRFVVIRHGVMPASRGGKVKTGLQALAILLYILPLSAFWHSIAVVVMTLAVIVTVATGVDYLLRAHTLRNTSPRAQAKRERRAAAREPGGGRLSTTVATNAAGEVAPTRSTAAQAVAPDPPAADVAATQVSSAEVPGSKLAATEVPASRVSSTEVPGSKVPSTEVPGSKLETEVPGSKLRATQPAARSSSGPKV
jgi:CDP-diacylglycerol--glycerol-3-phosphate 3-phosphatidyltransferase